MEISEKGLRLIKHFESYFDTAYLCAANVPTIGWGTTVYADGREVALGDVCTRAQAEVFLQHDMKRFCEGVTALTEGVGLSQLQFDALVAFAYNCGLGALRGSSLLARIKENVHHKDIVGDENMKWQHWGRGGRWILWSRVKGVYNRGLIRRRKAELWLYSTGELRFFEEISTRELGNLADLVRVKI
jgi:lysozyme